MGPECHNSVLATNLFNGPDFLKKILRLRTFEQPSIWLLLNYQENYTNLTHRPTIYATQDIKFFKENNIPHKKEKDRPMFFKLG